MKVEDGAYLLQLGRWLVEANEPDAEQHPEIQGSHVELERRPSSQCSRISVDIQHYTSIVVYIYVYQVSSLLSESHQAAAIPLS